MFLVRTITAGELEERLRALEDRGGGKAGRLEVENGELMEGQSMSDCARYFFAVYGAVDTSEEIPKPELESGSCPMFKPYISNLGIKSGDIMLLYCTNGYPNLAYRKAAPGVG